NPLPTRDTFSTRSGSAHAGPEVTRPGRRRSATRPHRRTGTFAAVAAGAVLFAGFQATVPAMAHADSTQTDSGSAGIPGEASSPSAGSTGSLLNQGGTRAVMPVYGTMTSGFG